MFLFRQYKESIKTLPENEYSWINYNILICFPLWENINDFIKISYCIFKIHKPSKNYSMKSSYANKLNSVSTKSNFYICIMSNLRSYLVGSMNQLSSQQLQMWFSEHFFAPKLARLFVTPIVSATVEQIWHEKMSEKPHSIRLLR